MRLLERVADAALFDFEVLLSKFIPAMRLFIFVLLLISKQTFSQKLDVGKVETDHSFDCGKYTFIDPLYGLGTFIDSMYRINSICNTTNQIEIRFTTSYAPTQIFEIVILSYDNNNWIGKKYEFNTDTLYGDSASNADAGKIKVYQLKAVNGFDSFFELLKKNNIFSLPDQKDIKNKPKGPTCGTIHSLTFKVDNSFRTYQFSNAEYYIKKTKHKDFRNYYNILNLLSKELEKE